MKKVLLFILLMICTAAFAELPAVADADKSRGWISGIPFTPLQLGIGIIDRTQIFDGDAETCAAFALLTQRQKSAALSFAPLNVLQRNYFVQNAALLNLGEYSYFLSLAPVSIIYTNYGLQTGLVNITFDSVGVQAGVVNFSGLAQIGAVNLAGTIQFGIFNSEGKVQFGLVNHNPDAIFPWMPFFNFSK